MSAVSMCSNAAPLAVTPAPKHSFAEHETSTTSTIERGVKLLVPPRAARAVNGMDSLASPATMQPSLPLLRSDDVKARSTTPTDTASSRSVTPSDDAYLSDEPEKMAAEPAAGVSQHVVPVALFSPTSGDSLLGEQRAIGALFSPRERTEVLEKRAQSSRKLASQHEDHELKHLSDLFSFDLFV